MGTAKRRFVKLKVPSSYLQNLPEFASSGSRAKPKKGGGNEEKKGGGSSKGALSGGDKSTPKNGSKNPSKNTSKVSSPAPKGGAGSASDGSTKINLGLKELSTSGLTMNSINGENYSLDKSGKTVNRWVKKPSQIKTFSGFKIKYVTWRLKPVPAKDVKAGSTSRKASVSKPVPTNEPGQQLQPTNNEQAAAST